MNTQEKEQAVDFLRERLYEEVPREFDGEFRTGDFEHFVYRKGVYWDTRMDITHVAPVLEKLVSEVKEYIAHQSGTRPVIFRGIAYDDYRFVVRWSHRKEITNADA